MDQNALQSMINGLKDQENDSDNDLQIPEQKVAEEGKQDPPLTMVKHQSMAPPQTAKLYGKRLYSPLANVKRINFGDKQSNRPYVIGICGGPGSGRSSVANMIRDKIPHAVILNLIHFYKPIRGNLRRRSRTDSINEDIDKPEDQIKSEIKDVYKKSDFDTPDAIDWELMNKGVQSLKNGLPFNKPIYDDTTMVRLAQTEHIKPSSVIIIEGHLIFCNEDLMNKMDLKVFIDADDDVRLSRRVLKMSRKHPNDVTFLPDFLSKYENYVKPSYEKFIEPTKKYADFILPNYGFSTSDKLDIDSMNIPAIDLIVKRVMSESY